MSKLRRALMQAAGSSDVETGTYVDDVFSTYVYVGNDQAQTIESGVGVGVAPVRHILSKDSGAVDITVNEPAGTTLVVFALNTSGAASTLSINGSSASTTADLGTDSHGYRTVLYNVTLSSGSKQIQVSDNGLGHTQILLVDANATVTYDHGSYWSTGSSQVSTNLVVTDGFALALFSDRDPSANFVPDRPDLEYYSSSTTYFHFEAYGMNGTGSQVLARTVSGLTASNAGGFVYMKVEGVGNLATDNTQATGDGGLVWVKGRNYGGLHDLGDTIRGPQKPLTTSATSGSYLGVNAVGGGITSFTNNGFTIGNRSAVNEAGYDFVSWTFKQAPGFFEMQTFTADSNFDGTIYHTLGCKPGLVIVKRADGSSDWGVYARDGADDSEIGIGYLNNNNNWNTGSLAFSSTSTFIRIFSNSFTFNPFGTNGEFIVYLFAMGGIDSDAAKFGKNENESIIQCGTTDGSKVTLGWEPQWILTTSTNFSTDWDIIDNIRGLPWGESARELRTNDSSGETSTSYSPKLYGDGFELGSVSGEHFYMAIRRPHKPASDFEATNLFSMDPAGQTSSSLQAFDSNGHVVDMAFEKQPLASGGHLFFSRLTGQGYLESSSGGSDAQGSSIFWDYMSGCVEGFGSANVYQAWMFRRAPGFFDVAAYRGTSQLQNIPHSLGVVPELIIIKSRTRTGNWRVFFEFGSTTYKSMYINATAGATPANYSTGEFGQPTSTTFTVGNQYEINDSTFHYVAYLFASVPGISKVGSYTGNGTVDGDGKNINCGFSAGARFVLIKSLDTVNGGWQLFDTERGIIAGDDPILYLNSSSDQVPNEDPIDPYPGGFRVVRRTASGNSNTNENNENYLFLAIA